MECMVVFFLAVCAVRYKGEGGRIDEGGWAATTNGGIAESDGMTVELRSFWRKPTEVGRQFEEVPRRLVSIRMCKRVRGESRQFLVRGRRSDN
jgi:hypothetical protein